jgi:hypothetical protein
MSFRKSHRLKYDNIESFKDIYSTNRFLLTGTLSSALSISSPLGSTTSLFTSTMWNNMTILDQGTGKKVRKCSQETKSLEKYSAIVWKGLDTWTGFIIRTQV